MNLEPVAMRRLYLQIADNLAEQIRGGEIATGQRLPSERELAARFQVSRPTVREAMIALEVSGLVEIRSGSGVYALDPDLDNHPTLEDNPGPFEILEARSLFEAQAAALAAERIGNEELQQLKQLLELMRKAQQQDNTEETEKYDQRFHLAIASASRNSAIATTIQWLWELRNHSKISSVMHAYSRQHGSKPDIDEHAAILNALMQRDSTLAFNTMQQHLHRVIEEFSSYSLDASPQ